MRHRPAVALGNTWEELSTEIKGRLTPLYKGSTQFLALLEQCLFIHPRQPSIAYHDAPFNQHCIDCATW